VGLVVPVARAGIARAFAAAATQDPTYDGPDPGGEVPPGFATLMQRAALGHGADDFAAARHALLEWGAFAVPGIRLRASTEGVTLGATCLVVVGTPLLALAAPCRVTRVRHEPGCAGFTYRTLPGHPEIGVEDFEVRLDPTGEVTLCVSAIARHGSAILRALGPVPAQGQRVAAIAYGSALRRAVRRAPRSA
jgi:uncharacterized protein (UPF0548 family)